MSETATALEPKTRVTRLNVGRVYNLGNYENQRVEITADIAPGDDPSKVLTSLENILKDLYAKGDGGTYELQRARRILDTPSDQLTEADIKKIPEYRETVAKAEAVKTRRELARAALSTLNYTSEHRDAKDSWSDDDDRF